jgi:hypothetical protein
MEGGWWWCKRSGHLTPEKARRIPFRPIPHATHSSSPSCLGFCVSSAWHQHASGQDRLSGEPVSRRGWSSLGEQADPGYARLPEGPGSLSTLESRSGAITHRRLTAPLARKTRSFSPWLRMSRVGARHRLRKGKKKLKRALAYRRSQHIRDIVKFVGGPAGKLPAKWRRCPSHVCCVSPSRQTTSLITNVIAHNTCQQTKLTKRPGQGGRPIPAER